jgi:ABC-2 type transport system ATP-binding protein/lipopolysaccharide transport system ATP-binding protein
MRRREIRARFDEIAEFSGVERFLDTPVKRYSQGMRLRLAFAVAAHLEPPIVVVDEVLAVGDAAFREKCMGKMAEMGRRDRTVLFVSHDLGSIARICTRAIWLDGGRVQADGLPREIVSSYLERGTPRQNLDVEFDADPGASVSVKRVSLCDTATGRVLAGVQRGQPFTIALTLELREMIPDITIAFILVDQLGVIVIDDALRDRPVGVEFSGEPGRYVASATIPPVLRAGTYTIRTWIGNDYEQSVERDLMTIRVTPRAEDPQEFMERTRAVQPEVEWSVRREPAP